MRFWNNAAIKAGKEIGLSDAQAKEYADDMMKIGGGAREVAGGLATVGAYGFLKDRLMSAPALKAAGASSMPITSQTSSITSPSLNKSLGMPSSSYPVVGEAASGGILSNVKNIVKTEN